MRAFFLYLVAVVSLVSCAGSGGPVGQTQVQIKGYSLSEIQQKLEEVFSRDGFLLMDSSSSKQVYQRRGGTTEGIFYGDWTENNTSVRVAVYFIEKGADNYLLRTDSRIVRNADTSFEDRSDLFDMQALKYRKYLSQTRNELKKEYPLN